MINKQTAERLLDFNAVIGNPARADDQLEGAVALHNILERHGIAYLADEVGMGKTYVALGVIALLRHFKANTRVLVIAPRENSQRKWQKEMQLFVKRNVRVSDMRVRTPAGTPVRPLVHCQRLIDLVRETALDPDRDFFMRMSSFSLPLSADDQSRRAFRSRLRAELPWLPEDLLDLRGGPALLKERFAQALNAALPFFDLVVVDEAHNLKHGFGPAVAARNRVLAAALGHPGISYDARLPHTGPRAGKVLLLSATPIDDDYAQLWRQLDVFGRGAAFRVLVDAEADEEARRAVVSKFLVRRVTTLSVGGKQLTKNLYRREWRAGGVAQYDQPIGPGNDRERLTVALVQKKVSELLEDEKFGASFQIGMLASFESFLETAGGKRLEVEETGDLGTNFDGGDQTEDALEREGVDVGELNGLARSHRAKFNGKELPHPKMDALAARLSNAWRDGSKALVFVRRVRSVDELKARVDVAYDDWLLERLRNELPVRHQHALKSAHEAYLKDKWRRHTRRSGEAATDDEAEDPGDLDTFFSYFFRGAGPPGVVSGAQVNLRMRRQTGALATFFADNHIMGLLGAESGSVVRALASRLEMDEAKLREELRERSRRYISDVKVAPRSMSFAAVQAAGLEMLVDTSAAARAIYDELYFETKGAPVETSANADQLERRTFFTELRRRPALRAQLWPEPDGRDAGLAFREQHLRGLLLSSTARLGHAFLDLWIVVAQQLQSLVGEVEIEDESELIRAYLERLEHQAHTPLIDRDWAAFDELHALSDHHDLILDVNLTTEERAQPAADLTRTVTRLLRAQRPVAGMSGQVNQSLVKQFRLPGYPLAMITTDLLQEGEDLHTFCSTVHHYGLAWTPSALEQRTGRIDRVRSQTERRMTALGRAAEGEDKLQVHYPHLEDTVERLQVRRVLKRMDEFIRLMHTDLAVVDRRDGYVNISRELQEADIGMPQPSTGVLQSAFGVREADLRGKDRPLEVDDRLAEDHLARFRQLGQGRLPGVDAVWEPHPSADLMLGTARLSTGRVQPFSLQLSWLEGYLVVRCVSPVGLIDVGVGLDALAVSCSREPLTLGVVPLAEGTYNATVEEDVLLGASAYDAARVGALVRRVTGQADELEYEHLTGRDHEMTEFRDDLAKDLHHAR
jgi:hypothetical protein